MNKTYPLMLAAGLSAINATCREAPGNKRPNIIFILADDLGYSELGCYGNKFNETPNLDLLAHEGVSFTQAYAAAPVSSPYRASLLTGQYPVRSGITDYLRPDAAKFLDTINVTLPEALKMNGYHTGIIGKWHLTGYRSNKAPIEVSPDRHGFDEVLSSETTGIADGTYFWPYHFNPALAKKLNSEHEFIVDRMNLEALEFIERNSKGPFFLYLSHYAVHTMIHGQPEVVDHFRAKPEAGTSAPSANNSGNDPYKKWPSDYFAKKNNPHLAAQLKVVDEGVGLIREKLKQLGIENNTIIIFTSDNGGETRVTDNYPLRAGKSTLYEGGVREPFLIFQPGKIAGGRIINEPMATYDIYPTLCELTGTRIPVSQKLDGKSLAGLLLHNKKPREIRSFYWYYPLDRPHFLGGRSASSIRQGDWKLIEFFDTGELELYNLKDDISEKRNLLSTHPEKAAELHSGLVKWREEVVPRSSSVNVK